MNLQLYMIDTVNYLVDFYHKQSYKASTEPEVGKFDNTVPLAHHADAAGELGIKEKDSKKGEVVLPYLFMDVASRLILELAGRGEQ